MSWYYGGIPILMYGSEKSIVTFNFLLMTDFTPLLLTDNTGFLLAG